MSKHGLGKFIIGASIGLGIGLLIAKKSGKETRADIKAKFSELEEKFKNLDITELKSGAMEKLDDLKQKINDLDQEKVAEFAREKISNIKDGLVDLSNKVKKHALPMIKDAIDKLSEKLDTMEENLENN